MIKGSYRRIEGRRRPWIGWMRNGCRITGVSAAVGRKGWYVGVIGRGPCRHQRRAQELQRRVDRTVAYLDELAAGPLSETVQIVVDAARAGLVRPAPRGATR